MRGLSVDGSTSGVYTWYNNYLNNCSPEVGEGCELDAYMGARSTCIQGKIINQIIPNPK